MRHTHHSQRGKRALALLSGLLLALSACADGADAEQDGIGLTPPFTPPGSQQADSGSAPTGPTSPQSPTGAGNMIADGGTGQAKASDAGARVPSDSSTPSSTPPQTSAQCAPPNWTNVSPLVMQAQAESLRAVRATIQGDCLSVQVELTRTDTSYALLLDTDGLATTGYKAWNWSDRSGADYLIQAGQLQRHDNSDSTRGWKWRDPTPMQPITSDRALEFRIPLRALQNSSSSKLWLGFMLIDAKGNPSAKIPAGNSFAALGDKAPASSGDGDRSSCKAAPSSATSSSRAKIPVSKGMIVPAYLPINASSSSEAGRDWKRLANQALSFSASNLDFWVVVSGANRGPLTTSADWQTAKPLWEEIRASGGHIFGYVHTCKRPVETPDLVDIDELMAQIASWVSNYPALDGIWLDEFNPSYELFGVAAQKAPPAQCDPNVQLPSYPNGVCAAPLDRSFMRTDGCFDPNVQVKPAGGYYDTLVRRIRAAYPWLRIIANAGSRLPSNQLRYADLVDVLVAYEHSFTAAAIHWSILERDDLTTSAHVAALFHTTSESDMPSALDHAWDDQYSHVYTTDAAPDSGTVWTRLSSYFEAEADYVTAHLRF